MLDGVEGDDITPTQVPTPALPNALTNIYACLRPGGVLLCVEIEFYGAFVLNRRVVLHAIDATPARWRGDADPSPLDGARMAASSP